MAVSKAARARRQQAAAERRWAAKDAQAADVGYKRAQAQEAARENAVDVSKLGYVKNWQECTAVAVNPHTNKSWNSYANVANERLKDVEYNRNIQRESPRKGSNAAKLRVGDASNYFQPLAQKVTK